MSLDAFKKKTELGPLQCLLISFYEICMMLAGHISALLKKETQKRPPKDENYISKHLPPLTKKKTRIKKALNVGKLKILDLSL